MCIVLKRSKVTLILFVFTLIFLLKKKKEALFAMQKLLTFFSTKNIGFSHFFNKRYWRVCDIKVRNFNDMLTNNIISFEQLAQLYNIKILKQKTYGHVWISQSRNSTLSY